MENVQVISGAVGRTHGSADLARVTASIRAFAGRFARSLRDKSGRSNCYVSSRPAGSRALVIDIKDEWLLSGGDTLV